MAIFFALLTFIGWGVGDLFVTIASRRLGFIASYYWAFVFGSVFVIGMIPFMGGISDWNMFFLAILLNIIHTTGNLSFFRGVEMGSASIVGTISGTFSMVSVILSLIFFKETLTMYQVLGIVLTVFGVILVSLKNNSFKSISQIKTDKGVVYGFIALFCWGIYFAFVRIPAEKIGWFWTGMPLFLIALSLPVMGGLRKNMGKIFLDKKGFIATILYMVLCLLIGDLSYNIGILNGFTSIVAPIAGSSTVLFVILSRFVFKEKLTLQQKVGIISSMVGILLISFTS